ncbi:MAG: hypothetical protein A4S12_03535 [Proteobacteria bacterium SG_bin5]|nr:hypothetical protein [Sphingomonas sp.]OQW44496.1 MAG: hypothetical protein A4S12_03535 [Proteobacteria bacterium SG_bin5]
MAYRLDKRVALGAALALAGLTAACADDYYDRPGYYSYYDGAYGRPYWGWYGNYYYPGTGVYVYDRYRAPRRWTYGEQRYWLDRQRGWRGGAFRDEWRGFRHVPRGYRR